MRRLRAIAIAAAAALATICSTAAAKEISAVSICGEDGCRAVADKRLLPVLVEGGPQRRAAVAPAGHFVVRVRVDHEGAPAYRFENVVLPGAGLLRTDDGTWMELTYAGQDAYAKLTRGREPLPASAMPAGPAPKPAPEPVRGAPAAQPAAATGEDSSTWPWLAGAAAIVLALSAAAARRARRRPASS